MKGKRTDGAPFLQVLRDGRSYIPRFTCWPTPSEAPLIEAMEVEIDDRGRARCLGLTVRPLDGETVTWETLRDVRVAPALRLAEAWSFSQLAYKAPGVFAAPTIEQWVDAQDRASGRPRRGARLPDELLEKVAGVYRAALDAGERPTQAVMFEWAPLPRSTASRWVAAARERGLLGPAEPGRATS